MFRCWIKLIFLFSFLSISHWSVGLFCVISTHPEQLIKNTILARNRITATNTHNLDDFICTQSGKGPGIVYSLSQFVYTFFKLPNAQLNNTQNWSGRQMISVDVKYEMHSTFNTGIMEFSNDCCFFFVRIIYLSRFWKIRRIFNNWNKLLEFLKNGKHTNYNTRKQLFFQIGATTKIRLNAINHNLYYTEHNFSYQILLEHQQKI